MNAMEPSLLYNEQKDMLFVRGCHISSGPIDRNCKTLFSSYDDQGWNKTEFNIPTSNFNVKIESNFGYGSKAYLRSSIIYNGIQLINFPNVTSIYDVENMIYFSEKPELANWCHLLNAISEVYRQKDYWNLQTFTDKINDLYEKISQYGESTKEDYTYADLNSFAIECKNLWLVLTQAMKLKNVIAPLNMDKISDTCAIFHDMAKKLYNRLHQEPKNEIIKSWIDNGIDVICDFAKFSDQRIIIL